jgi:cytochrome c biogenesis protein CcmG/thiol:disulfide interchange protein DsbE
VKRVVLWLPFGLFVAFVLVAAIMLRAPSETVIRSHMIGKPLPAFALPAGITGKPGLSSQDLARGKPRLLNVFASWCIPCAAEAPQLVRLAQMGVPVDAIAIRDRPEDIKAFLDRWGDPYQRIGSDTNSRVQLAIGSSGVPESFIIDGKGIIRYQHIGDIRPEQLPEILRQYQEVQ